MFQSWGLCQVLRQLGHEPEIIDYRPQAVSRKYLRMWISKRSPISRPRQLLRFRRFIRDQLPLSQQRFNSHEGLDVQARNYDALISGSDEIWNLSGKWSSHQLAYPGLDDAYFLAFANSQKQRLISYAASTGETTSWEGQQERVRQLLQRYHHLSVREETGRRMLENIGLKPSIVLDPALLADYSTLQIRKPECSDYVLVFSDEPDPITAQLHEVISLSGLKAISVGFHVRCQAGHRIAAGPEEMIGWIKQAKLICTSMFHGVVLALKFGKDFVYFPRPNKTAKARHILAVTENQDREYPTAIKKLWWDSADIAQTNQRLTTLRTTSLEFLTTTLQ